MSDVNRKVQLTIRPIQKGDPAFPDVQRLMETTWSNESLIPEHLTLTFLKNGGLLLGGFDGERLVAFSLGFAGFNGTDTYLCSHMLAVEHDYRHLKIGEQMKWHQRLEALKRGYRKMVWTYDPLESVNAYFNLTKLGAVCRTYIDNCYGEMNDELNRGLPSDRFQVEWHLDDPRVESISKDEASRGVSANAVPVGIVSWEDDMPRLENVQLNITADRIRVPLPTHFQRMKKENRALALDWRQQYRAIFHHYFALGYRAVYVERVKQDGYAHYLLERE